MSRNLLDSREDVRVEHLLAKAAVEAFDLLILVRLAWLALFDLDLVVAAPVGKNLGVGARTSLRRLKDEMKTGRN